MQYGVPGVHDKEDTRAWCTVPMDRSKPPQEMSRDIMLVQLFFVAHPAGGCADKYVPLICETLTKFQA